MNNLTYEELRHRLQKLLAGSAEQVYGFSDLDHFAILLPLIYHEGCWQVLFEVRSATLRRQPNEICFPGGRMESDDGTPQDTAIRETAEELGLTSAAIEIVGKLGLLVPPNPAAIHLYVGILAQAPEEVNPLEVAEWFTIPLHQLLTQEPEVHWVKMQLQPSAEFPYHYVPGGKNYQFRLRPIPEYFYLHGERVVWGLTARILNLFLQSWKS